MPNTVLGKVSITPKGNFSLGTPYNRLDLVYSDYTAYLSKTENIGVELTDVSVWMKIVEGMPGKSAYESAVDAGYTGTEEEFIQDLINFEDYADRAERAAANAEQSEQNAKISEENAASSETAAKESEETARSEADRAKAEADRAAGASGFNPDDFATAAQGQKADTALQGIQIDGVEQEKTDGVVNLTTEALGLDDKVSKSEWEESRKAILTEGTGEAYTATVPWIKELTPGAEFIMIPHVASDSTAPTLNVNGLGAKQIRRRHSATSGGFVFGYGNGWLTANAPIRLIYSGLYWITDLTKPESFDISGIMSIEQGGTGANNASSACTNLGAVKKSGDTMTGILYAQSNTSYTTAQVRNIQVSTSDLTAGTSTLASGNLYFVYE